MILLIIVARGGLSKMNQCVPRQSRSDSFNKKKTNFLIFKPDLFINISPKVGFKLFSLEFLKRRIFSNFATSHDSARNGSKYWKDQVQMESIFRVFDPALLTNQKVRSKFKNSFFKKKNEFPDFTNGNRSARSGSKF